MSLPLIRYLLTAMKLEILTLLGVLTAIALLQQDPITAFETYDYEEQTTQFLTYLFVALGLLLPTRIFCNPVGVGVWLSSRGLTRRQQFVSRLTTGLIVIALSFVWVAVLQTFGIRQFVQQSFGSPWFPMVRWNELAELPHFAPYVCFPFFVTTLVLTATMSSQSLFPTFRITLAVIASAFVVTMFVAPLRWTSVAWAAWPAMAFCAVMACVLWTQSEHHSQ
ncbi:MAG: hypothetical protein JNM43_06650 [Planctomycetaceae bacterium]|nr:hypothetical protein [Planctomycetaceae bacterium]